MLKFVSDFFRGVSNLLGCYIMLTGEQLTNILAECNVSLFMVKLSEMSSFSGLLDLED
jgi:hypothetical protein